MLCPRANLVLHRPRQAFWQHVERVLAGMAAIGVQAELILFADGPPYVVQAVRSWLF